MIIEINVRKGETGVPKYESHKLLFIDLILPSSNKLDKIDFAFLNKSLLSLLKCISIMGKGTKDTYVPFRDSLLTKLMKDHIINNENTICLGLITTTNPIEDNLKSLDFLSKLTQLKIRRYTSVQLEINLTPNQFKEIIIDLEDEKSRLKQMVVDGVTEENCDCVDKIESERKSIDVVNKGIKTILYEKLNYIKSINEIKYMNDLNMNDLSKRKKEFMEKTLSESGHFVAKGGNIEDFLKQQDKRFQKACHQLEEVIIKNFESQ